MHETLLPLRKSHLSSDLPENPICRYAQCWNQHWPAEESDLPRRKHRCAAWCNPTDRRLL